VIFGLTAKSSLKENPVTLGQSDVYELLDAIRAGGDIDIIRKGVELVLQALIDADVLGRLGVDRNPRWPPNNDPGRFTAGPGGSAPQPTPTARSTPRQRRYHAARTSTASSTEPGWLKSTDVTVSARGWSAATATARSTVP
jgi:hypothetical protein